MKKTSGESWKVWPVLALALSYWAVHEPQLSPEQRHQLASTFTFRKLPLHEPRGLTPRSVRTVNPRVRHIDAWISSVGAAVSFFDFDGDGLSNDCCLVDSRFDTAMVAPAPGVEGASARYEPVALEPRPLPYDPATMAPMGSLPGDYDEDGDVDLLVYFWGRSPVVYMNTGHMFEARELVTPAGSWYTSKAIRADFDGDGRIDLAVGNYFPENSELLDGSSTRPVEMQSSMSRATNGGDTFFFRGAGGFLVPASVALAPEIAHAWTLAMAVQDIDGDLLPELYLANDFGPDALLHNRSIPGEIRFAPLRGERRILDPRSCVLGSDSFKGMGVDIGDLNADGHPDIFVSNIAAKFGLRESHFAFLRTEDNGRIARGVAPFEDRSFDLGLSITDWAWDCKFGDFDNDGDPELVQALGFLKGKANRWPELQELATANDYLLSEPSFWPRFTTGDDMSGSAPAAFFVRTRDGSYADVALEVGLEERSLSRGLATADVDGDGDLDLAVANQWNPSSFYMNGHEQIGKGKTSKDFLGLKLGVRVAEGSGGMVVREGLVAWGEPAVVAIGAAVELAGDGGSVLRAQVDGGNGHSGVRSNDLHFGLGEGVAGPLAVTIRWRDRAGVIRTTSLSLPPGWHTVLLGAQDPASPVEVKSP